LPTGYCQGFGFLRFDDSCGRDVAAVVYGAMRIPGETITPREAERALKSEQAERAQRAAAGK